MPTDDCDGPRIATASQDLPLAAVVVLLVCAELTFAFIVFAVVRRQEPIWWLLTGLAVALGCVFYGQLAYGRRNWDQTAHLKLSDGTLAFVPSRRMRLMGHITAEAAFPTGGILEYHIETGDLYFTGDRDQFLRSSLWIAEPNGTRRRLMTDLVGLSPKTMAANLLKAGIPFRVVKIYDGQTGEHVESNVTGRYTKPPDNVSKRMALRILIGTSNLWVGVISALLFHEVGPVVAIGVVSCFLMSIARMYSKTFKRVALVQIAVMIPLYAVGYGFAVIAVWYLFRR